MASDTYKLKAKYDKYLKNHVENVKKSYDWLLIYIPEVIKELPLYAQLDLKYHIIDHDKSKYSEEEFVPYSKYFGSSNVTPEIETNYYYAWLHHIHNNPHHWQYWVIVDNANTNIPLEMPKEYVLEMICDWWSFSWSKKDLSEIFRWYDERKEKMIFHPKTQEYIEYVLDKLKQKVERAK